MPLIYSQYLWGFEVFDSGSSQNNRLAFVRKPSGGSATTYDNATAATLKAGVYTADELAAEVQRAMRERTSPAADIECSFSYTTLKFETKITGTGNLSLLFGTGAVAATDCNVLLGYTASDHGATNGANGDDGDTYLSDTAVAAAPPSGPGVPAVWALAEPVAFNSPVVAGTLSATMSPASRTNRSIIARQQISDGMKIESIHFGELRKVQIAFKALTDAEQAKMEAFLDWAAKFKRFTWQPDKTSANGMKLVLANPGQIANFYEWLTRPEVGYGSLTFYEQLA